MMKGSLSATIILACLLAIEFLWMMLDVASDTRQMYSHGMSRYKCMLISALRCVVGPCACHFVTPRLEGFRVPACDEDSGKDKTVLTSEHDVHIALSKLQSTKN